MKLRDQPVSPARHMQRLDDFIRHVNDRPQPYFQLPVLLDDQSGFVAQSDQLFWSVTHGGTRLTGDPILLDVCRTMLERSLNAMPPDRRINSAIADRIEGK